MTLSLTAGLLVLVLGGAAFAPAQTGPCTRRTSIVLSEIHYHPAGEADGQAEFIELYNSSPISVDLSGWKLRGDADLDFPEGTRLAGGEFLIVAADPSHPTFSEISGTILGPWSGDLSNDKGTVRLRKASGGIVLETNYRDDSPWPAAADGEGHSLVLKTPALGESQVEAWGQSLLLGGSPGEAEPLSAVDSELRFSAITINEAFINSGDAGEDFIEFHNRSEESIDLSGCFITQENGLRYEIPAGTFIGDGAHLAFTSSVTGLEFSESGERVFLRDPDGARVIDGRKLGGQVEGFSWGKHGGIWRELETPTPSMMNGSPLRRDIVINEIHYHPSDDQDAGEFIELHNTSTEAIDLSDWSLDGAITFTFTEGSNLNAGDFFVIAKDQAVLLSLHPTLDLENVHGDFSGQLSNRSESILLKNAAGIVQDEVHYFDGGRWPSKADGGGSSLQLIDPRSDNSLHSNWTTGDESGKAVTVTVEHTGVTDLGHQKAPNATRCFVRLEGEGEAIIDDIEVLVDGQNLISNGDFNSALSGWNTFGTHQPSFAENAALHLVTTDGGDDANLIERTLNTALPPGTTVTIRATCRWVSGSPHLLLGLNGGWLEAPVTLPIPQNVGTPGAENFDQGNSGPAITQVQHSPLLPLPGEPITVTAQIDDPDDIFLALLRYRIDPATSTSQVPMTHLGGGQYRATIPAQLSGTMIAFHIVALDSASPRKIENFPSDAPTRECLVRVGDSPELGDFSTMHLWTTQATHDEWRDRVRSSNLKLDGTFVSDGQVYYNVGLHYAGSQNGVSIYNSPTGNPTGYNIELPGDEVFLNSRNLTLDRETTRDATRQRERLLFWFLEKLGLPNLHRRYVHVFFNGVERDQLIMEDVQKPNREIIDQWFSGEGRLTKTNPWFEFDANGTVLNSGTQRTISPELDFFPHGVGSLWTARDRRTWTQGAGHDNAHDFSGIRSLIEAAQATANDYLSAINSKVNLRQWMRTFAMNDLGSYWDTFGNPGRKNAYLHESLETGKWSVVVWDMDVGLGVFNDPVTSPLFPATVDPAITRMYEEPSIVRNYWQALDESLGTFFNVGAGTEIDAILQETFDALIANDAAVTSPFAPSGPENLSVNEWISQRGDFLENELAGKNAPFQVSAPNESSQLFVTISGSAPLDTESIFANDIPLQLTWSSITEWTAQVALQPGSNMVEIRARDADGNFTGLETLTINYTGSETWPELRINEWMASNPSTSGILDPADSQADDWVEIYNPTSETISLNGWSISDSADDPFKFQIPSGFSIPANGYLLIWADDEIVQNDPTLRNEVHANFKLSSSGESIILSAPDGSEIDRVDFSAQTAGISRLRIPDGGEKLSYTLTPSPAQANPAEPTSHPTPVIDLVSAQDELIILFESLSGVIYELESSTDLSNWTSEASPKAGQASLLQFPLSLAEEKRRFYRVRLH